MWALAKRADSPAAYNVYLQRFPTGRHAAAAAALLRLRKATAVAPSGPSVPMTPSMTTPDVATSNLCTRILIEQELGIADRADARAYFAASRSNRPEVYAGFLVNNPGSACTVRAVARINARHAARLRHPDVPGLGPLPPKRLDPAAVSVADYPTAALRKEQQGEVLAAWTVAEDGEVEDCRVVVSSGHAELDIGTCDFVTTRFRYDPARDAAGHPIRASDRQRFRWQIEPNRPPRAPPPGA